jgi:hypothetical protein
MQHHLCIPRLTAHLSTMFRFVADTLENRILPAIARHMAEIQQQQPKEASNILQPKLASGQVQPKQAARVRGTATFTSSGAAAGQRGGTCGTAPTARGSWGVPPPRKPSLASRAPNTRKAGTPGRHAQISASPSDLLKTRCMNEHSRQFQMHTLYFRIFFRIRQIYHIFHL